MKIRGLAELQRDLTKYAKDLKKELRTELALVAEPVRATAAGLASSRISHIGSTWPQMRVGVTSKSVYVAPKAHNRGGSPRPNLGAMLMGEALEPALEQHTEDITRGVESLLDHLANRNGF